MSDSEPRPEDPKAAASKRLQRTADSIPDLWRYYEEHAAQARQHETLRASVASILGGAAAAVVALATSDGVGSADAFAGVVVIALGMLGAALSIKHYERNRMHTSILGEIRKEIADLHDDPDLGPRSTQAVRDAGVQKHKKTFAVFGRKSKRRPKAVRSRWVDVRLHHLWIGLNLSIALVGVLLIVASWLER